MSPGSRPSHGTFPAELPASSRIPPRTIITRPKPRRNFPSSATSRPLERQLALRAAAGGDADSQMRIGRRCCLAAGGRADEEADLEQERLHDLRQCLGLIVDRRRDGFEPDRAAAILLDDGPEKARVEPIEPFGV